MDKYKVFQLAAPIEVEGKQAIAVVHCQRPKWKHIKRLMEKVTGGVEDGQPDLRDDEQKAKDQKQDMEAINDLMRDLCKLSQEEMDEMDMHDVMAIQEWLEGFTKKYQKDGTT